MRSPPRTDRLRAQVSLRKRPQQARSNDLVAAVLQAAVQVLQRDGVRRFTTSRIAERAGVSIGSLYQYFPNKAAILFRLQTDEWRQTSALLRAIFQDARQPPLQRLRAAVHAFVRSECDEAAVRGALSDAAPRYREAPEAGAARGAADRVLEAFIAEALPAASQAARGVACELIATTLGSAGKRFSQRPRSAAEIAAFAGAMADMFCAYLGTLGDG